jgi:Flp pilus assembly protein TadD/cell division septation protein DedD
MNSKLIKFAGSSLVLGMAMVGCKPAADAYRPASASSKEARTDQHALKQYQKAELAFRKGDLAKAVEEMEAAVLYSPLDAGFRMALAELYMKNGRFVSAEATFRDVLALNPANGRAAMALALAQAAQGKSFAAQAQLAKAERLIAPADVGLGYAIAGNPQRAIEILEAAARAPDADARLRQNLALAYAFAGDWKKARVIAAQDISPAQIEARMAQWAALADPSAPTMRVAGLLGVTPAKDKGQPTRLALSPVPDWEAALVQAGAPAAIAAPAAPAAEPAMIAAPAAAPVVATAAVQAIMPAPVVEAVAAAREPVVEQAASHEVQPRAVPAAQETFAPIVADEAPAARITPAAIPAYVPAARKPSFAARAEANHARANHAWAKHARANQSNVVQAGGYVVQIGAFSSAAQVERAWAQTQRRHAFGGAYAPLSTTVRVGGKGVLHRLSIAGFNSRNAAVQTCLAIRARSGVCFVRAVAGDAPVQWASRYTRKA